MLLKSGNLARSRLCVAMLATALTTAAVLALSACGGSTTNATAVAPDASAALLTPDLPRVAQVVTKLTLGAENQNLRTGATDNTTTITAIARDVDGAPVPNAAISFSAPGEQFIGPVDTSTNSEGKAFASITTRENKHNREIVVTARTKTDPAIESEIALHVSGTKFVLPAASVIHPNVDSVLTVRIVDGDGAGVPDFEVTAVSSNGSTLTFPSKVTDSSGNISFTLLDAKGGTDIIELHSADGMIEHLDASTVPLKQGDLKMAFNTPTANIVTGVNVDNSVKLTIAVKDLGGAPVKSASVAFTATETGTIKAGDQTTDESGNATVVVGAGQDLSNRSIQVTANVAGNSSTALVTVSGTKLAINVSPLMTALPATTWQLVLKDGAGKAIANSTVKADFGISKTENAALVGIDPKSFQTLESASLLNVGNPKVPVADYSPTRTLVTDATGIASIPFGVVPASLLGQVLRVDLTYGAGNQKAGLQQHIYEGVKGSETSGEIISTNLLTESSEFRYESKMFHRLFLTLPVAKLYEVDNASGPTGRNDTCNTEPSRITMKVNGQIIVLRGKKISNRTCSMDWGGDFFGAWNVGTQGYAVSDFRIWFDPSDNKTLPAGRYIAPVRFNIVESNPDSGKDIPWGAKDVVVYINQK